MQRLIRGRSMPKHKGKRGDFWSKVCVSIRRDRCWEWIGSLNQDGYGQVRVNKRLIGAHRVAWELTHGAIPDGLKVLHNCPAGDNPSCVNPAHLFLGTQQENITDMVNKGRHTRGESHIWSRNLHRAQGEDNGRAKLTAAAVRFIRKRYAQGGVTFKQLARAFAVSDTTISSIVKRKIWRNLQ